MNAHAEFGKPARNRNILHDEGIRTQLKNLGQRTDQRIELMLEDKNVQRNIYMQAVTVAERDDLVQLCRSQQRGSPPGVEFRKPT
jgi:hypothetical protein